MEQFTRCAHFPGAMYAFWSCLKCLRHYPRFYLRSEREQALSRVETGLAPLILWRRRGKPRLYLKSDSPSERALARVVAGAIMRLKRTARRRVRQVHPQLTEFRIRMALGRIVGQQILGSEFVADLAEGVVQLRQRLGVVILAACIRGDLNQRMLAASVPPRVRFDGHDDDAVNNRFRLLGGAQRFFVVHLAHRVSAVGDYHHHFSSLPPAQRLRAE